MDSDGPTSTPHHSQIYPLSDLSQANTLSTLNSISPQNHRSLLLVAAPPPPHRLPPSPPHLPLHLSPPTPGRLTTADDLGLFRPPPTTDVSSHRRTRQIRHRPPPSPPLTVPSRSDRPPPSPLLTMRSRSGLFGERVETKSKPEALALSSGSESRKIWKFYRGRGLLFRVSVPLLIADAGFLYGRSNYRSYLQLKEKAAMRSTSRIPKIFRRRSTSVMSRFLRTEGCDGLFLYLFYSVFLPTVLSL